MTHSRTQRSVSPPPGLSRASTPDSSAPSTPVLPQSFLQPSKMSPQKPQVGFSSPMTTSSYRRPEWDELSVMRAFASHATHCNRCSDPERTLREGKTLCRTGTEYAKDIGKYFYCLEGKPYSQIDRKRHDRVQVEVPVDYVVVKNLFEALAQGLKFAPLTQKRPEVHQTQSTPAPTRVAPMGEYYDIKPSRTSSRRHSANVYPGYNAVADYETRTPYDERYREPSNSRPRDSRRESSKRGSLYVPTERRSKNKSYVVPFSAGWLR